MSSRKLVNLITILLLLFLVSGTADFLYNSMKAYKVVKGFISIPLQFDPYDSSSEYQWNDTHITAYGAFIKGIQNENDTDSLVVRALSPLPSIILNSNGTAAVSLRIENINPDFYASSISGYNLATEKISPNTLRINIGLAAEETFTLQPAEATGSEYPYIILGDNRDGYDTFENIIDQINQIKPAFVIDNGDLVFSGKTNQYRLFDQLSSTISTTLCTTLGNHDIRDSGRGTYTKLYGPAFYSF